MPLPIGAKAPDLTLKTMTGDGIRPARLGQNFGKGATVLLFVPAAFSGVCTEELCGVGEGLGSVGDALTLGVSRDSPYALAGWAKAKNIQIPLLSDYQLEAATAYDVLLPNFADLGPAAARAVFVIDAHGVIRYSAQTPSPGDLPDLEQARKVLSEL